MYGRAGVWDIETALYDMAKARYMRICRHRTRFGLMRIGYNLKRGFAIQRDCYG